MGLLAGIGVLVPFPFYYWLWTNPQAWVNLCGKGRDPSKVMAQVSHFLKLIQLLSLFSVSSFSFPIPLFFWPLFLFGQFLNFRLFPISIFPIYVEFRYLGFLSFFLTAWQFAMYFMSNFIYLIYEGVSVVAGRLGVSIFFFPSFLFFF